MRPAEALRRHIEMGSTGSLTVERSQGGAVSVYLLQGEILAAESPDDGSALVRRLINGGYISAEQGHSLLIRIERAPRLGEVLFGAVTDDVVVELYGRRFRQNLADYLMADGGTTFVATEDIHVENVQVGHDSYELLEQMDAWLAVAAPLMAANDLPRLLLGDEPPANIRQERLLDILPSDGSLEHLLDMSPYEPVETLVEVADLLVHGGLLLDGPTGFGEPPLPIAAEDPVGVDVQDDEPTGDDLYDADESLGAEEAEDLEEDTDEHSDDLFAEPMVVDDMAMLDEEEADEGTLAMFADHDHTRGRSGDGVFTVSRDLLDTVDLSGISLLAPEPQDDDLVLEMEDGDAVEAAGGAVSLRFGSPPLTGEEAFTKIEVTNEVLRQLALALDEEHGSGSGQATVQLLIESARTDLAVLFVGIEAARDGALDTQRMIANIDKRPESERRRLLNRAMRDLIERGFTSAVERISDERFEALLERIAGYQHRLGL